MPAGNAGNVLSNAVNPDGERLASGSKDRTGRLSNLCEPDFAPLVLGGHKGMVFPVAYAPNGQTFASASDDKAIRLWKQSDSLAKLACQPGRVVI
jgi:WD40 repeat protein